MLDVFYTVDVEIWCGGWVDIESRFPDAYRRHILGATPKGNYGLPFQLQLLNDHGLKGVFFTEPLFAGRFGMQPLQEIVQMIQAAGQEVQLHPHTEWVDEMLCPVVDGATIKRQNIRQFNLADQTILIEYGLKLLRSAGAYGVNASRAGSFGFNRDTLSALAANGITFDSSYNVTRWGPKSGVMPGVEIFEPIYTDGVYEYPITVYRDMRGLRHAQLTACSFAELEGLLWQALEDERKCFVMLAHSFELLNIARNRPDPVVIDRFRKLCAFLNRNRDCFRTRGFLNLEPASCIDQPPPLHSPSHRTALRMVEQAYRRVYG